MGRLVAALSTEVTARTTLKIFKVKNRARALRFCKPAPLLGFQGGSVGENTCPRWVTTRVHPQEKVGENTCPSTGAPIAVGGVRGLRWVKTR